MWVVSAILFVLFGVPDAPHATAQGVRVVDAVNVTLPREEIAHAGSRTAALLEVRTVQEHLE